jgi:methionyl aminopeptidase
MPWRKRQIRLKSADEIEKMALGGKILAEVFLEVRKLVQPGAVTAEIDAAVERMIRDAGCVPSFKGYNGFPASACISVNEEVVHGIPTQRELRSGDIVGIDVGLIQDGYHADSAETLPVGQISDEAARLLQVTEECLEKAITKIQAGNRISDIGIVVESHARTHGFSVVESLVGHGIGRDMHEDPQVPNYRCFTAPDPVMEEGLVIAVEPMINTGTKNVVTTTDQWTVVTADKSLSAHFEHTVAVTANGPRVLTEREFMTRARAEVRD